MTFPMENRKKKVTLLVPAFNEEEVLDLFYNKVSALIESWGDRYDWEILFINDGSTDRTLEVLRRLRQRDSRVNYIDMARNYGKEIGMLAGFDHATGDCVITIDADLQEPPETIPLMLSKWEEGFDDVYGRRRKRKQSFVKRMSSKAYHKLLAVMSEDVDLADDSGDFRLLDRKCIDAMSRLRESQRYTKGLYSVIGFRKAPVDYDISARAAGTSKWTPAKLMRLAVDGITSHSVMPLRLASYLGLLVSLFAFLYLIFVLIKAIAFGDTVAGYPTLICVLLFLGGSILLALGIIGEYLGRIFIETKHRPAYFLNSINDSLPKASKNS